MYQMVFEHICCLPHARRWKYPSRSFPRYRAAPFFQFACISFQKILFMLIIHDGPHRFKQCVLSLLQCIDKPFCWIKFLFYKLNSFPVGLRVFFYPCCNGPASLCNHDWSSSPEHFWNSEWVQVCRHCWWWWNPGITCSTERCPWLIVLPGLGFSFNISPIPFLRSSSEISISRAIFP